MIKCADSTIAVCSWSVKNNFEELEFLREKYGLTSLHLALAPALEEGGEEYLKKVVDGGWDVTCTMIGFPQESYATLASIRETGGIVPDDCWETNKDRVIKALDLTAKLGVKYLSCHFGFFSYSNPEKVAVLKERVLELADLALARKVVLLMETGQETDQDLKTFLEEVDHEALGVNFDPANMILYNNADPIDAVSVLAPWIKHVHIKDAIRTEVPGTWGKEVPWSTGQVGGEKFLAELQKFDFKGAVAIEREAGAKRIEDISLAIDKLNEFSSLVKA